jgi:WD40 repeat protein
VPVRFAAALLVVIGLALPGVSRGAPPVEKAARTDLVGDPLPEGVVARLGTERLVLADTWSELTFSPDGRHLATYGGRGDQPRIWDVSSGKELLRFKAPPNRWHGRLVFSPDGKTLAMGYGDERNGTGMLCVWEAATGKELHNNLGGGFGQRMPASICFSPDGRSLFAGGDDRPIQCWDLAGGGEPRKIGDFDSTRYLALSRDGKEVTAGRADGSDGKQWLFARWDLASGKKLGEQTLTLVPYWSGALSPDGRVFARPEQDGKSIALLDPMTGRETARARDCHYPAAISFSADGAVMTCLSKDGIVHVWETATGKVRTRFQALATGIDRIVLSPDGKRLALMGRADQAIHIWDLGSGRELHSFAGHRTGPLAVAFSRDGQAVLTASRSASQSVPPSRVGEWSLRRWDPQTGKETRAAVRPTKGEVYHAALSPDGSRLAVVEHDGTLRLWDTAADKELRAWKVPTRESRAGSTTFALADVSEPRFTADGKTLFVTHNSSVLRWDTATGKELLPLKAGEDKAVTGSCQPSPDGRLVVTTSFQGREWTTTLFDVQTGRPLFELTKKGWVHYPVAFSPDGRTVALTVALGDGPQVLLWEVASGRPRGRLAGAAPYASLAFSPDGRFLAVGGDDKAPLRLWDLTSDRPADAQWLTTRTLSLAFSPDGRRLALAGFSNTALVCDVRALFKEAPAERLKLSADDRSALWADLTGPEGDRAYRAVQRLAASGPEGVAFLKARLKAPAGPDAPRVARLIKDLDDDEFDKREKATEELMGLGRRAEAALREALKNSPSAEARARIEGLLARLKPDENTPPSPELVGLRVVEALELNGGAEARAALDGMAKGTDNERLAAEAKASLARLAGR